MGSFNLPPLKNSERFEHFVCELFNYIEKTDSYVEFQIFGKRGQNQKGIDIFSQKNKTVIQCKAKDSRSRDDTIRIKLLSEIENDLDKVRELNFPFHRMFFASTFRDDSQIQEHLNYLQAKRQYSFSLQYIGWDTLTHYAEDHDDLLKKYFPQFRQKNQKTQLPGGALGTDLHKKNYVNRLINRYGDWKQFQLNREGNEKFNFGRFKKLVMNRYKATGINHIPLDRFDDLIDFLQKKIDGTAHGKNQAKNYSTFDEYLAEIAPKVKAESSPKVKKIAGVVIPFPNGKK